MVLNKVYILNHALFFLIGSMGLEFQVICDLYMAGMSQNIFLLPRVFSPNTSDHTQYIQIQMSLIVLSVSTLDSTRVSVTINFLPQFSTECHVRVVNTPASYSGGSGFKSPSEHRLS
jgi:hypothetical protein